jgi:hypothetical protein
LDLHGGDVTRKKKQPPTGEMAMQWLSLQNKTYNIFKKKASAVDLGHEWL